MSSRINSLADLQAYRSAPHLNNIQETVLFKELSKLMKEADWFTVGIMAPKASIALSVLHEMENRFHWEPLKSNNTVAEKESPVFLKANQKTGDVYMRNEANLGEGVLLTCQHYEETKDSKTLGPFPLGFFKIRA